MRTFLYAFHIVSLCNSAPFNVQYCMCDSDEKVKEKERKA